VGHDRRLASWRRLSRLLLLGAFLACSPTGCGRSALPTAASVSRDDAPRNVARAKPAEPRPEEPRLSARPEAIANRGGSQAADQRSAPDEPPREPLSAAAERLLLLLPAAPLLVELRITVDGQPFRHLTNDLVEEMIRAADRDGDGRPTWGEVFADPKRIFGRSLIQPLNMSNRKEFMRANDANRNGLVDRNEARRFLEELNRSAAAFSLASTGEYRQSGRSIVWTLLDADRDDVLDRRELAAIEQRLLIRDANDDQTVTWAEMDDSLAGDEVATARRRAAYREDPAALSLGPSADWELVRGVLAQQYLQGPTGQSLVADLDANRDGRLIAEEVAKLDVLEPQVVLSAAFGKTSQGLPGVSLVRLSPETLAPAFPISEADETILLSVGGCRVRFAIDQQTAASDRWPSAGAQLAELDTDKNGYLQKQEVEGRVADAAMFGEADANSDGKIDLDELTAYRRRQQAPLGAIYALVGYEPDFVFSLLDSDADGRLTTRERRAAISTMGGVDSNADGHIDVEEIPSAMVVILGRGRPPRRPSPGQRVTTTEPPADLPRWFVSMDANGDGEISREEFPGSSRKFRSLDLDDDGFIVASEAQQAVVAD
jgi:Ca2+-binding EF-hand superfamily protein